MNVNIVQEEPKLWNFKYNLLCLTYARDFILNLLKKLANQKFENSLKEEKI